MQFEHIYIHVPFCLRKCHYCDFISYPLAENQAICTVYGDLLLRESALWRKEATVAPLKSIYWGGGTPSLLPPETIQTVLAELFAGQEGGAPEITLEANPESVTPDKLIAWREAGVNRLSIGVQSFADALLKAMGRPHTAAEARQAVAEARKAGFTNVSVDLIYGLPGQDLAAWQQDLEATLAMQPQHVSLYGLSLSEDSHWGREVAAGRLNVPDQDLSADLLEEAMVRLPAAGYVQYEISNFALLGYESRHNSAYWQRDNYLGLGVAAASCAGMRRWSNERDLAAYQAAIAAGKLPQIEREDLHIEEVLGEALFLGLRLRRGIDQEAFSARYGVRPDHYYKKQIRKLVADGLLEVVEDCLRLTQRGLILGNEVFLQFA